MGDLIHTLPALTDLARRFPDVRVDWLAEEAFVDIPRLHPAVDQVIPIAWRRWRKRLWHPATWGALRACHQALNARRYDLVLDMQGLIKSALVARWVRNTPLGGYAADSIREPLASRAYDKTYQVSRSLSAIERNRRLMGLAFGYQPDPTPPHFGIQPGPRPDWLDANDYAVLLTATSRAEKEWPETHWLTLGAALQSQGLSVIWPWGSPPEHARALRLAEALPGSKVAPRLSLAQAAGLLGHAAAVVGVDTGLTHLANALDRPLVAIYTDTDPQLTGVVPSPCAINLGGVAACPNADAVLSALARCRAGTVA